MKFLLFFAVFSSILGIGAFYIIWRLLRPAGIKGRLRRFIISAVVLIILTTPVTVMFRRAGIENQYVDGFTWAGYLGLGFLSFIFTFIVIRDLSWSVSSFCLRLFRLFARENPQHKTREDLTNPSRRIFLINSLNVGILGTSGAFTCYGVAMAKQTPHVKRVEIPVKNLPSDLEGFRIVQLSDIHVSPTIKRPFVEEIVATVNALKGDIVVLTGDLVDGSVSRLENDVAPLSGLKSDLGCYFITGNHEYYSGVESWIRKMRSLGFTVLLNENRIITKKTGRILLAGVTDYRSGRFSEKHNSDPLKAMKGGLSSHYKILLAHQPKNIFKASEAGFDLQISGHTHGGQFFPWNIFVYMTQPFIKGLHKYKNTQIYVSQGTGYWGPPVRLGAPSEITLLRLVNQS